MKMNIELELSWINDECTIDDVVQRSIAREVVKQIQEDEVKKIRNSVSKMLSEKIDEEVEKHLDNLMSKEFDLVDEWGDTVRKSVNVKQMMKEKLKNFMNEKVGSDGTASKYNGKPRYQHILDKHGERQINDFISKMSTTVIKGIKDDINDQARKRITDAILSDYDLKKVVK